MAGRPRKPTKLLALQGTARADRHGTEGQWFELPPLAPKPPEWLSGEALARWLEIVNDPSYANILSALDGSILLAHCVAHADVASKARAGAEVTAAMISALLSTIQRLGLSPADRARIKLPEQKKEFDEWTDFLGPQDSPATVKQ